MYKSQNRILYKETIHCPIRVLNIVSIASIIAIDLLIFVFWGTPKWSFDAIILIIFFSMMIYFISMAYSWFRYSVKLKIFKSFIDNEIYLSLRGVGKGAWMQIPTGCITSTSRCDYRAPLQGLWFLLILDLARFRPKDGTSIEIVYALPGYVGQGLKIEYKEEKRFRDGSDNKMMLIPTKHPDFLGRILAQKRSECS